MKRRKDWKSSLLLILCVILVGILFLRHFQYKTQLTVLATKIDQQNSSIDLLKQQNESDKEVIQNLSKHIATKPVTIQQAPKVEKTEEREETSSFLPNPLPILVGALTTVKNLIFQPVWAH